jgi:hypothetical protein
MTLVTFLRDFQGRATAERFYPAGTVVDLPEGQAAMCLAEGAVAVVAPEVPVAPLDETGAAAPSPAAPAVKPGKAPARKRASKKAAA